MTKHYLFILVTMLEFLDERDVPKHIKGKYFELEYSYGLVCYRCLSTINNVVSFNLLKKKCSFLQKKIKLTM